MYDKNSNTNLSMISLGSILSRMERTTTRNIPWKCWGCGSSQSVTGRYSQANKKEIIKKLVK